MVCPQECKGSPYPWVISSVVRIDKRLSERPVSGRPCKGPMKWPSGSLRSFVLWLHSPLTPIKTNHIFSGFIISYSKWEKAFPSTPSCCCTKYGSRTDSSDKTETDTFVRKILTVRWRSRKRYWKLCVMETPMCRDFQWCFQQFNVVWGRLHNFRNSPEWCFLLGSLREISASQWHCPWDTSVKAF